MSIAGVMPYRIVFLGMEGIFSSIPLETLFEYDANVVGVVVPRPTRDQLGPKWLPQSKKVVSELPILNNQVQKSIRALAGEQEIPILSVGDLNEDGTIKAFQGLEPDLVITACFPRLLPKSWLGSSAKGCLNIHPSLLPAYRGPSPLFWQFRNGEMNTGVTLHFMDAELDSGDIVGQKRVVFEEGISAIDADRRTAEVGASLILEAISPSEIPRRPQPTEGASYHRRPTVMDRTIARDWPVRHAFNFFRGADEWAPFWIDLGEGQSVQINQALGYELDKVQSPPVVEEDGVLKIQMKDGLLQVRQ